MVSPLLQKSCSLPGNDNISSANMTEENHKKVNDAYY